MLDTPDIRYARNGDVFIAYQILGDASVDLVYVPGWLSHLDLNWEWPPYARFLRRLASFSRLIVMDRRGVGLSDRSVELLTVEHQVDDLLAVLDHAAARQPAVFGSHDGATMACVLAASHPNRVHSLVTYGARARFMYAEDYPWGTTETDFAAALESVVVSDEGSEPSDISIALQPSLVQDPDYFRWSGLMGRSAASPGSRRDLLRLYAQIDMRPVLPAIRVPVLVLNRRDDQLTTPNHARYLAERIPDARYVELAGADAFLPAGDLDVIADEIEEFITGHRGGGHPDRVLATIMFTDIVRSTEQAAELGDRRWTGLLDEHDRIARREVDRHRGRVVKTTGDGVLATFDGPARGVRCATAVRDAVRSLGITIRAGLHIGEVELRGDDVGGMAVHIAARVMAEADPGEVLVSRTVTDLVTGSGIDFRDRGNRQLKGVAGSWTLYAAQ